MNGVLVVDKPSGPTSHDVVARVRNAIGVRRVGHTGTLDPLATGVLPLVIGRATRLAQFFSADEKEYVADIRFGWSTATYDAEGCPKIPADRGALLTHLERADLEPLLDDFRGAYWQTPPPFSAKKVSGVPAHRLARSDRPVELKPVKVTVRTLELVSCDADVARLRVVCSSGFYVRTLAHELGDRLGCGAYLETLRRMRAGDFSIDDAVALEGVERKKELAVGHLMPMSSLLPLLPPVIVNERGATRAAHGNALLPGDLTQPAGRISARVRVLDGRGTLLGIAESSEDGLLRPIVVLV